MRRIARFILLTVALSGCSDAIVLRDDLDGLALTYWCADFESQATSTAERAVVSAYGAELLRSSHAASGRTAAELLHAYNSDDWERFERAVVQLLCADPSTVARLAPEPRRSRFSAPGPGDPAPPFVLPVLSGRLLAGEAAQLSLSELRGNYVMLAFWSTWCAPCAEEYPELIALQEEFGDRGLAIVGVLHEDSPAQAMEFVQSHGPSLFPTVVDDGALARAFQIGGIPVTVVIDPWGRIASYSLGWFEGKAADYRSRFESLLADEQ